MLEYQGFLIMACVLWTGGKTRCAIAAVACAILSIAANPVFVSAVQQGFYSTAR